MINKSSDIKLLAFICILVVGGGALSGLHLYGSYLLERANETFLAQLGEEISLPQQTDFQAIAINDGKIANLGNQWQARTPTGERVDYTAPPTAFDFARLPEISKVALSPNGQFFASVQRSDGKQYAVIREIDGDSEPVAFNFNKVSIDWISWARDDRVLIGYSLLVELRFLDIKIYFGGARVLAADRDAQNTVVLFKGEPSVVAGNFNLSAVTHMLPDDPAHILMPAFDSDERLGIWRVNVDTGDAALIEKGTSRTGGWFADRNGKPRIRIDANKRGTYLHLFSADSKTGQWRKISSGPWNTNRMPNVWPIATADTGNGIYVLAHAPDEDRVSIKLMDSDTGALTPTDIEHSQVDIRGGLVDARSGRFLGGSFIDDQYNIKFKDKHLQAHYNALRTFFNDNANVYIENISAEGGRFLVYVSGPDDPGDYYIYDYNKTEIFPLFATRPHLNREYLSSVETIRYQTRDGLELTAYLTHPNGLEDAPAPLVVMPHGGPEVRDFVSFNPQAQFLASRGYRVLQPNFRGSSGYGKAFVEAGYGEWGRKMQDDIDDATAYVLKRGLVDGDKICIAGASYGGYAALVGAIRTPSPYRCAISVAGVSDLLEFLKTQREEDGADSSSYEYWTGVIGHPRRDRKQLIATSPKYNAANISIPILLVHGDVDKTVLVNQSRMMRQALIDAGKRGRYIEFKGERHSYWKAESEAVYLEALDRFLYEEFYGYDIPAMANANDTEDVLATQLLARQYVDVAQP